MSGSDPAHGKAALQPLPYQAALRNLLKVQQRDIWDWFASHTSSREQAEAVRLDILKSTYRLDAGDHAPVYEHARYAADKLGLDVPLTIYQAQNIESQLADAQMSTGLNAALAYLPDELHIIFHGEVATRLSAGELRALLGHELTHFVLWRDWEGDYYILHQLLAALCSDSHAHPAHFASARLLSLYNEIYCDRGAHLVVDDPEVVVAMLVKVQTNLDSVSGASYIRQAAEIFDQGVGRSTQVSHPETFIRARAIQLWSDGDQHVESKIQQMIQGTLSLDDLDLLDQRQVAMLTRRLIDLFLSPRALRTEATLAFARAYFADYQPPASRHDDPALRSDTQTDNSTMQDYFCYVLLDLVTADRDLEELPLAQALIISEQIGLKARFVELARRELRLRKKQLDNIDRQKESMFTGTAAASRPPSS